MFPDDLLLPISALQHLQFCRRRCALVHLEGAWQENRFTAEGQNLHQNVHDGSDTWEQGTRVTRGLRLISRQLGLYGVADVVEFVPADPDDPFSGEIPLLGGFWTVRPVEYKRGHLKADRSFEVQLCAQSLCLEELFQIPVPFGLLYFGKSKRRKEIPNTTELREKTISLAEKLHDLIKSGITPPAEYSKKCDSCSLEPLCMPKLTEKRQASNYLKKSIQSCLEES